ncbi:MAG: hypothetical protein VX501_04095 [Pseudomonadota bacterium]|nr:hypothetical protein [Pseudomonadota bacterium]
MIQPAFIAISLLVTALAQTPDPVTTETRPRQLIALEGQHAEDVIARARQEACPDEACDYVFRSAAEIAGSMCWNDAAAGETYCRDAVVGTRVEFCHADEDGSLYDCGYWEMMEGEVSAALADDPRLAAGTLRWFSQDRGGDAVYDILESAYCAQPPEGACTRMYNFGVISIPDTAGHSLIFEHCWDDAATGLPHCRQAIIDVVY